MKGFLGIFVFIIIYNFNIFSESKLSKIFHHKGTQEDKIVFYFDTLPEIKKARSNSTTEFESSYDIVFPKSIILDVCKEAVRNLNSQNFLGYSIELSEVKGNNIRLKIIYDPDYILNIEPLTFDAIHTFRGISIHIRHKTEPHNLKYYDFGKSMCVLNARPIIILDFGHGGEDNGTIGINNTPEKNITYDVGMKVRNILMKKGYNVFLTRDTDKTIALEDRTSFANSFPCAAFFLSLHANYAPKEEVCGIETYYTDKSLLKNFRKDPIDDQDVRDAKSELLAANIHNNTLKSAKKMNGNLIDRKVKKSVSQVLLGTEIPAALIELGFLSNKKEADLLSDSKYQKALATGICKGIDNYLSSIG